MVLDSKPGPAADSKEEFLTSLPLDSYTAEEQRLLAAEAGALYSTAAYVGGSWAIHEARAAPWKPEARVRCASDPGHEAGWVLPAAARRGGGTGTKKIEVVNL